LHALHSALAALLQHLLTLLRGGVTPLFAQGPALIRRKLLKSAEILPYRFLLIRRQGMEPFPALAQLLALFGWQGVPLLEPLLRRAALLLRHAQPTLTAACERLLALRR
jgi:hypothetical protein